jgi:predicted ATPase
MTTAEPRPRLGALPADVNRFVGRRHEIAEAKRLLGSTRLLTLTGVGGVGKTRLALRVAADLQRVVPDGVHLVELSELRDSALLGNTVATSLGLQEQSARWRVTALIEHIGERQMLIVLDNCEHLADACAVLVDSLLRECGQLRVLATSREPLRVGGESILTVPPCLFRPPDRPPHSRL